MPINYDHLTYDTWMLCEKRGEGDSWRDYMRFRTSEEATSKAAMARVDFPHSQWRVERRQYK